MAKLYKNIKFINFKKLNYYWRVIATGLSFLIFGIGGILLRIIIFPLLNILIWKQNLRINTARNIIRVSFRFFIEFMHFVGVLKYHIQGLERLDRKGLLILANHPTLIDTVFLMAFVKHADCIVKSTLWRNPFTHGPVRAAGYICNNNGPDLIKDCIASLKKGNNLIIFPEGTRTERDGMIKFKRGAAHIAIQSQHKITPIVIQCVPSTLTKGEKWWNVPPSIACFSIAIKEDINVQNFISARELNTYLVNYFMNFTKES